jgi:hypothetical protein
VNSRLQRGLAEVRRRLGAERGDETMGALLLLAGGRRGVTESVAARAAEGALMGAKTKAAVACAVAVLLGTVAWRAMSSGSQRGAVEPTPTRAADASSRPTHAQALRPRAAAEDPRRSARDSAAATTAEVTNPAKPDFTGVVMVSGDAPRTDGEAWASGAEDGERRILTRVPLRADGTFELFVGDSGAGARDVEVGASVPGFVPQAKPAALTRGSATRVELRLVRGARITGTVVDKSGVPVGNLRLLARSTSGTRAVVDDSLLDTDALVAGPFDPNVHWAWATTDASGRFAFEGLGPETYAFLAESPAWILVTDDLVRAGAEDVRVVARPAFFATLRVRDAKTGEAVKCHADVTFRRKTEGWGSASSTSLYVPRGELRVRWDRELAVVQSVPVPEGRPPGEVRVTVTVRADGYHARELPIAYDAEGPQVIDAALDPVADETLGKLRLEVVDGRGEPVDFGIETSLYDVSPDHASSPTSSRLSKEKAGTFVLSASPGRWTLRVGPDGCTVGDVDTRRDVEIVAGGSADLRIALPASGFVVVRRKARDAGYPDLCVACEDTIGNSTATTSSEREVRFRVAPGTFKVKVGEGDAARTRDVAVRAFEETVVEIED